jgi:hypothetical protein
MLAAIALSFTGFTALALSMDRHQRDVFGRRLHGTPSRWLRCLGWLMLAASPAPCVVQDGWGIGLTGWLGALTLAAAAVVLVVLAAGMSGVLNRAPNPKASRTAPLVRSWRPSADPERFG